MFKNEEDLKQVMVLFVLAIAMFAFIFTKQNDYARDIITAFIAIIGNNSVVKSKDK